MEFYKNSDLKLKKYLHIVLKDGQSWYCSTSSWKNRKSSMTGKGIRHGDTSAHAHSSYCVSISSENNEPAHYKLKIEAFLLLSEARINKCESDFAIPRFAESVLLLPVLILSEKLHSVTSQFDELRAVCFQKAINRAMPRRKPKRAPEKTSTDISYSSNSRESRESTSETIDHGEILAEPMKVQQQLLVDETRALQDVVIAYGFNKIEKQTPESIKPVPLNQFRSYKTNYEVKNGKL
ncbi:SNARE-complex protein Syntaxin-18 N-terminal [Artemisia annua]|uniref:SNARE-complex protein Syntaxin-18 N-terminal n=1 Tax=Artemisia annua TaxID=35608 RepID=A0A2U1N0H5_ARTAN|nr:SNARE-complex protein Syntaxin-18 N-terminal [Artemisia annua]